MNNPYAPPKSTPQLVTELPSSGVRVGARVLAIGLVLTIALAGVVQFMRSVDDKAFAIVEVLSVIAAVICGLAAWLGLLIMTISLRWSGWVILLLNVGLFVPFFNFGVVIACWIIALGHSGKPKQSSSPIPESRSAQTSNLMPE